MKKGCIIGIVFGVTIIIGSCFGYLQYGRDMDVCGSFGTTSNNYYEERLNVVANKLYVSDQEACAKEIIERCRKNNFKSVRFSYDQAIPNALYVNVYSSKQQIENGNPMFTFSYLSEDLSGIYNIVKNPEKFVLEIE